MGELRELYQEMILDHGKRPRNFGPLSAATHSAEGHNPICGDRLRVELALADGRIAAAGFEGAGCAISMASASMMTEALRGRDLVEVEDAFRDFHDLVTGQATSVESRQRLGKLIVFQGVREFPVRIKCATLAWHTLRSALAREPRAVTTE